VAGHALEMGESGDRAWPARASAMIASQRRRHLRMWWVLGPALVAGLVIAMAARGEVGAASAPFHTRVPSAECRVPSAQCGATGARWHGSWYGWSSGGGP
jgi:hypothetical protein